MRDNNNNSNNDDNNNNNNFTIAIRWGQVSFNGILLTIFVFDLSVPDIH